MKIIIMIELTVAKYTLYLDLMIQNTVINSKINVLSPSDAWPHEW